MNELNLDSILRTQSYRLVRDGSRLRDAAGREEVPLWEDPLGPLKIFRVIERGHHFHCLRFGNEVAVDVMQDNELAILPVTKASLPTINHFLADQVLPRVLSQRDELVLHAGAVRNAAANALLLLGPSGSGKSTLAASFHRSGWTLMGDDAAIIFNEVAGPSARAVYPSLRLFPDSVGALLPDDAHAPEVAHYSTKKRISLSAVEHSSRPFQVNAAFLLASSHDCAIAVSRLSVAEACMAYVENSFALDPSDAGDAARRMARAAGLAERLPLFALSYPHRYDRLPDVRQAMLALLGDNRLGGPRD